MDGTVKIWEYVNNHLINYHNENNFMTDYSLQQFNYYQSLITNEFFNRIEQQTNQHNSNNYNNKEGEEEQRKR